MEKFPEEVIQHIQSFLRGKKAAETCILSKSWYNAWLTHPNLDLDDLYFWTFTDFVRFANSSMQRYYESNRKIQSFRLHLCWLNDSNKFSLANQMIPKAIKLGATDFNIRFGGSSDIALLLLDEVLSSRTLATLSLYCARFNLQIHKVNCSKLKSLSLQRVCIEGNNIWDLILMCPSIEELVLSECEWTYDHINHPSLIDRMLVLNKPADDDVCEFHKLRVLLLKKMVIGEWFFPHISTFPCLKDLTLEGCIGYQEIQICSNSLEFISLSHESKLRLKFDVPRIRKFKFSSNKVPSLSFKTEWKWKWESDINFKCIFDFHVMKTSWFNELREFLLELSSSKIYLSLNVFVFPFYYLEDVTTIGLLSKPVSTVEKLRLEMDAPSKFHNAILKDIFWSCRPNFMTLYLYPPPLHERQCTPLFCPEQNNEFTKLLCDILIKKGSDDENRDMSALRDLEDVGIEIFQENAITGRKLVPLNTFLDASANSGKIKMEVCLQLRWG